MAEALDQDPADLAIVGIGASAGGINALQTLFGHIPSAPNVAFVIVVHMLPDQPSQLARLFAAWTPLPVREASAGMAVEAGHVYIAPPGYVLGVQRGVLTTTPVDDVSRRRGIATVDGLFESLAAELGDRAIGVVLSGTGMDGAAGAVRIKQAGGIVFAQDPATAMHHGMPTAVIENGAADHVMSLGALALHLMACGQPDAARAASSARWSDDVNDALAGIIGLIGDRSGVDLSGYKTMPVLWRVQRRMQLRRVPLFRDYEALLHDDPAELETLIRGMPIHVTEFFRDPPMWDRMRADVVPALFASLGEGTVRAWTPACSSGEEAYTLAMLLADEAGNRGDFQVFATDASEDIVARAGRGVFTPAAVSTLSVERRQRYFYAADGAYRVKRTLRDKMVFAPHDLLSDPPFGDLHVVTCRNLLIYLEPEAAQRVIFLLHSSLRMGGCLFLGKSESLPPRQTGFTELATGSRIYRKTGPATPGDFAFPKLRTRHGQARSTMRVVESHSHQAGIGVENVPAVVIDERFQVVRVYGDTSPFLRLKPGDPTLDLLELLSAPHALRVRHAAQEVLAHERAVTIDGLAHPSTGANTLSIRITPLATERARMLVAFLQEGTPVAATADPYDPANARAADKTDWSEALRLSHAELESSREELQALNEELRASNDQLNIANEDLNEANTQLRDKLGELETQSNVLSAGAVMTLFLDEDLRVRFFTPGVGELFPIRAGDIGRRITDLAPKFDAPSFLTQVHDVMRTGAPLESEVRTLNGHWYLERIRPFRTGSGGTANAGVAITFTDVTDRKAAQDALHESDERISKLVGLMPAGVCTVDASGQLTYFNQRATELWGRVPVLGDPAERFCGSLRMWTRDGVLVPHAHSPMADAVHLGLPARSLEVVLEQPSGARIVTDVNIDPLHDRDGKLIGAISVFVDVTDRKHAQEAARRSETALAAELGAMQRLHEFSIAARATQDTADLVELALDALIELQNADMGNVQLLDEQAGVLRIVAQRGFDAPFLEHFAAVDASDASACGRAMATRERVVFEDIEQVEDEAYRAVARQAGYRGVQSTPLVTVGGTPLGMVSTHFREPRILTDAEARVADILANELTAAIERTRAEHKLQGGQTCLEAQNEALRLAMSGASLETSLGVLLGAALDDTERRCAFYLADESGGALRHVVGAAEPAGEVDQLRCWSFPIETSTGALVGSLAMYFPEPREPSALDRELAKRLTQTAAILIAHGLRR